MPVPRNGVITGVSEGVVDAEGDAAGDDVGLGHVRERGVDFQSVRVIGLNAGLCAQVGGALEGGDELRAAVGIAGIVDGVHANEDVAGLGDLGVSGGEGEKDEVAGGDVGDGDAVGHVSGGAILGNIDVGGERGAADGTEVDGDDAVVDRAENARDLLGGDEFVAVALAVIEGEGVTCESGLARDGECGGTVQAAGEEDDGAGLRGVRGQGKECRKGEERGKGGCGTRRFEEVAQRIAEEELWMDSGTDFAENRDAIAANLLVISRMTERTLTEM